MVWTNREHDRSVLHFIGVFDLRGCIYVLRCLKDGRHRIRDATKNFLYSGILQRTQTLDNWCL